MRSKVQRWGNSLAVRIPKPFALEAGIEQDCEVEVTLRDGAVLVVPLRPRGRSLAELLAEVTEENVHREVDLGPPLGREAV